MNTLPRFWRQKQQLSCLKLTSIAYLSRLQSSMVIRRMATTKIHPPRDPNTLSNYNNFLTTHTTANLRIDFNEKRLTGNVVLDLKSTTDAETREIVLDTSHLDVKGVKVDGDSTKWELLAKFDPYGRALKIKLESGVPDGKSVQVDIALSTTEKCTALQWLTPAQTSNKKHPYIFSQCQAIHARSLFPCQDTPDVKSTDEFNFRSSLPVLASGLPTGSRDFVPGEDGEPGTLLYTFTQDVPMPSYLVAIASGDLASAAIGPRSTVWTGPEELQASKWELERDTENFIQVAERLIFPYAWTTYNILVLPPSFPYGGMENPIFTFATPTIISGDRENVDVIAHELSHSWSGNLVSNASWEHFWLNEGWTTYLERRIQAAIHGESHRNFSAIIGWKALEDSIASFGEDHEFTKLIIDLKGKDPDDAFSSVPYEKGFLFLYHLEKLIGKETWDKFIPHYFTTYARKSLDSYDFKSTLLDFFASDASASKALHDLDWDTWFYAPGFPPKPKFDTSLVDVCYALADKWATLSKDSGESENAEAGSQGADQRDADNKRLLGVQNLLNKGFQDSDMETGDKSDLIEDLNRGFAKIMNTNDDDSVADAFKPSAKDIEGWTANQIVVFLEKVEGFKQPLSKENSQLMAKHYGFMKSKNVEVVSRYFTVGLKARDKTVYNPTADLLGKVGRMKFVRPLFRELNKVDRELAVNTFEKNRDFYHPICRAMVEKDLYGKG